MYSNLPNFLSILRIILSPVFFFLFIASSPIAHQISLAVFLLAAVTDWYDGELARRRNAVTNTGKFLDPLADKCLTSAAFIAFAFMGFVEWWMVIVIIARDFLITLLRSIAETRNVHIVTSKSAQTKTFIQMTVLYYLLLLIVAREIQWIKSVAGSLIDNFLHPTVVYVLMMAVTLFTLFTGFQYIFDNRKFIVRLLKGTRHVER